MNRLNLKWIFMSALLFYLCFVVPAAGETKLLWQIGKPNNDTSEFLHAPGSFYEYVRESFFVVGKSDPKLDWSYVHPGPVDCWAGSKMNVFTIIFSIDRMVDKGESRLIIDLVDTHDRVPPVLQININGSSFKYQMPKGAPAGSIYGDPSTVREYRFTIPISSELLRVGNNKIDITTLSGSWVLYDWIGMETPKAVELGEASGTIVRSVIGEPMIVKKDGKLCQSVRADVYHFGEPVEFALCVTGTETTRRNIKQGFHTIRTFVPAVEAEKEVTVTVDVRVGDQSVSKQLLVLRPVRNWKIYLLPHSHVDIGYTKGQMEVERDHWDFYEQAIEASRKTANYPKGSRFKWNVEVLWAVDGYLKHASPEKQKEFIEAIKAGWIGLDALYSNELTALCRQEELVRLMDFARHLSKRCGIKISSAMITDIPGFTWGIVPVLAHSGVKYFSIGPNFHHMHRTGYTMNAWSDRPFYWVSPSNRQKVLCWFATKGYWKVFNANNETIMNSQQLLDHLLHLEHEGYPYDIVQARFCTGDNQGPCVKLSEFVKKWNAAHASPELIIATTNELFHEFERRYGSLIPAVRGDFTPYWEDGAGSSARETAINRAAAERLVQAETMWAMLDPEGYPADDFYKAWRNVVLFDEHTWGSEGSISEPENELTRSQWKIKQSFVLDGDMQSRQLLDAASACIKCASKNVSAVDVFNTSSWIRTDLVILPKDIAIVGDIVKAGGKSIPSQRFSTGELAFLAREIPPFGAKRFTFHAGEVCSSGNVNVRSDELSNGTIALTVDEKTGAIVSLTCKGISANLVDNRSGVGLNSYFYVPGRDPKNAECSGQVNISVKERGPLVASLVIESDAPGCNKLSRELRVIDGLDRVDIIDVIDKQRIYEKEGVHIGFAFNVPDGVMRMDIPWAVMRPEADQLPGACKNWFTVQRWVDMSNQDYGVTWVTVDAPLVEVGAITADVDIGRTTCSTPWIKTIETSQTLYSYVMNNYWHTNFKESQEGPTVFRYSILPHRRFDAGKASRFGIERSQPLVVVPVDRNAPVHHSLVSIKPVGVIVTAFKPTEDGNTWILRLFNAGGRPEKVGLTWAEPVPAEIWLSNLAEEQITILNGQVEMAAYEIVTLLVMRQ